MAHKQARQQPHADGRRRSQVPLPAVDEVAQRLLAVLSPSWLAPRQRARHDPRPPHRRIRLRQRRLTWPVMVASMVRLGWRRVPSGAAGQQSLTRDGLVGGAPRPVSPQALITRRDGRPAAGMGPLCGDVWTRRQALAPPAVPSPSWAPGRASCPWLAMVDGATLEARRNKPQVVRQRDGLVLAGTVLVRGEAVSPRRRGPPDTADARAHDPRVAADIRAALPVGGLLSCARGVCRCLWCDALTAPPQGVVTRRRAQTASRAVPVRSASPSSREAMIQGGPSRAHPCRPPRRLVAVRWPGGWSRDLPTGLAPPRRSARQGCAWSRPRWRLAAACALTPRRWDVASVWPGSTTAGPWQRYAPRMCSAVLVTSWQPGAQALGEPVARSSGEMVCRALSHESRAVPRGACDALVPFVVQHATRLGLVKRWRQQHRARQPRASIMWGDP